MNKSIKIIYVPDSQGNLEISYELEGFEGQEELVPLFISLGLKGLLPENNPGQ